MAGLILNKAFTCGKINRVLIKNEAKQVGSKEYFF
jgi:hypothetical protein